MSLIPLDLVFEDEISGFLMSKLVESQNKFFINRSYSEGGSGYIKKNINGFNDAAKGYPFFVLTDLDFIPCATNLINEWFKRPIHPNMIFRIAVREIESWLLADIEGFSKFTGVSKANFIENPDELLDPKGEIFRIVRRCNKRDIKEDILPKDVFAKIGPNYNGRLIDFTNSFWSAVRASSRSRSLNKALKHIERFTFKY